MVDRVKPWFMVHGSGFCSGFCSWFSAWFGAWDVLPFDVHLDLGHLSDTQGYLGLLPEPCTPTQGF